MSGTFAIFYPVPTAPRVIIHAHVEDFLVGIRRISFCEWFGRDSEEFRQSFVRKTQPFAERERSVLGEPDEKTSSRVNYQGVRP